MYLSDIRAAISVGQRPTAMILNDPYGGHRKWWVEDWPEDPALVGVWTEWDYILLRAYQYIEDYTSANGHMVWIEEDPDVYWDIDPVDSGYERDVHKYRETHEVKDWQHLRARPSWEDDVEAPSMEKWLRRMDEEAENTLPTRPEGGTPRPPTPEELARLRNPQQNP